MAMKQLDLTAFVYEGEGRPIPWIVEAIDHASDGDVFMAFFTGPGAEQLAEEYAHAKYRDWRKGQPANAVRQP